MKRTLAIIVAVLMVLCCCACGDNNNTNTAKKKNETNKNNANTADTAGDSDSSDSESDGTKTLSLSDPSGDYDEITLDTPAFSYPKEVPVFGASKSTMDTKWEGSAEKKQGNTDAEANALRNNILSAKNTLDIYNITGRKFYVSPNGNDNNDGLTPQTAVRSTDADLFTTHQAQPGDAILFERGGLWRMTNALKCDKGVTYGAYGTGEKPTFYGSAHNYAKKEYWTPSNRENIWKLSIVDDDVGLIALNDGESVGIKKLNGIISLEKNNDFYFNNKQEYLYFYCDKGNPGKVYDSIEIGVKKSVFSVSRVENVTLDNLRVKYVGTHGITLCDCDNSTITNCEIGFIGGCIQSGTVRLGNAIQVWNGVQNHRVENCWIYQVYDAALTFQGDNSYKSGFLRNYNNNDLYKDITYTNNLVEYSTYSFEFWHGNTDKEGKDHDTMTVARFINVNISNNISRFAGYGWGRQRPDHMGNHICVWRRCTPNASNCRISNNLFDLADGYMVYWQFKDSDLKNNGDWTITGNTYYHCKNKYNEGINFPSMTSCSTQEGLESCVKKFEATPKKVVYIG